MPVHCQTGSGSERAPPNRGRPQVAGSPTGTGIAAIRGVEPNRAAQAPRALAMIQAIPGATAPESPIVYWIT